MTATQIVAFIVMPLTLAAVCQEHSGATLDGTDFRNFRTMRRFLSAWR